MTEKKPETPAKKTPAKKAPSQDSRVKAALEKLDQERERLQKDREELQLLLKRARGVVEDEADARKAAVTAAQIAAADLRAKVKSAKEQGLIKWTLKRWSVKQLKKGEDIPPVEVYAPDESEAIRQAIECYGINPIKRNFHATRVEEPKLEREAA